MPGFGHPAAVTSQAPSPAIPGGNVPRVTSRPVLLLQDGDGPGMAPASRSCPTHSSHPCVSLHIPTCAVPREPPRAPGHPALLRECRWHPENQPWPEGDTAITTLGTVKIWWLRVELPWAMSQRLRALGWVWRGQRGTSPAITGWQRLCRAVTQSATTPSASAAPSPLPAVPAGPFLLKTPQNLWEFVFGDSSQGRDSCQAWAAPCGRSPALSQHLSPPVVPRHSLR